MRAGKETAILPLVLPKPTCCAGGIIKLCELKGRHQAERLAQILARRVEVLGQHGGPAALDDQKRGRGEGDAQCVPPGDPLDCRAIGHW